MLLKFVAGLRLLQRHCPLTAAANAAFIAALTLYPPMYADELNASKPIFSFLKATERLTKNDPEADHGGEDETSFELLAAEEEGEKREP